MEMGPEQALEQEERVYLVFPVCLQPVYQTVVPFCHMTVPRSPLEREMCLPQPGSRLQGRELPARGMAVPAYNWGTAPADRLEGRKEMASALHKDTVVRTAVGTDHRQVPVLAAQLKVDHR